MIPVVQAGCPITLGGIQLHSQVLFMDYRLLHHKSPLAKELDMVFGRILPRHQPCSSRAKRKHVLVDCVNQNFHQRKRGISSSEMHLRFRTQCSDR